MKITDKNVFFWSGFLSNWYEAPFKGIWRDTQDTEFNTSEQYFMYQKAKYFNDKETAQKILKTGQDPKTAKALGRSVKNYNEAAWEKIRYLMMLEALFYKFEHNKKLQKKLFDKKYENKHFVEGSPIDNIWGVGVHWSLATDDVSTWKGKNLLGKALDEVREMLQWANVVHDNIPENPENADKTYVEFYYYPTSELSLRKACAILGIGCETDINYKQHWHGSDAPNKGYILYTNNKNICNEVYKIINQNDYETIDSFVMTK